MVGLLYLAAKQDCLDELAEVVIDQMKNKKQLNLSKLEDKFTPKKEEIPLIAVPQHPLSSYNELIATHQKARS